MTETDSNLVDALGLMERALVMLDEAGNTREVGAHLDLAINRLRDLLPGLQRADEQDQMPARRATQRTQ